ncbi:MAG: hypothetical protein QF535_16305 [Anaerolineales bacterium]|nr:hypothetical protein [Anaerolineales bacterium]
MRVLEVMERAGTNDTKVVLEWIKDAIHAIESSNVKNLKIRKQTITENTRDYDLPADLISINSVSVLDTEDDNKYKKIRRLVGTPVVSEDTNP